MRLSLILLLVSAAVVVSGIELSSDKFTFGPEDAKQAAVDEDEEKILEVFETILSGEKEVPKDEAIIIKTDDDDGDDDDDDNDDDNDGRVIIDKDVDENDDEEDEIDDDASLDTPKTVPQLNSNTIRRQGDLYGRQAIDKDVDDDNDEDEIDDDDDPPPTSHSSPIRRQGDALYPRKKEEGGASPNQYPDDDSSSPYDSPRLRLTEGGYQRPPQHEPLQARQSEERPAGEVSPAQQQQQPQVAYYQQPPQVDPMFYNPFQQSNGPFAGGFFSARPYQYPSNSAPFMRNEFQEVSRDQNPFAPQYQAPSMVDPSLLFQGPQQFVPPPMMADARQRPVPSLFQQQPPVTYAGSNPAARPDYSVYFRNSQPPPMHLPPPPFQQGGHFYSSLPDGRFHNNPTLLQPNGGTPAGLPRTPDSKQQQEPDTVSDVKKAVASDTISASPDKEDRVSVPFGTRIQQQSPFAMPRDVYIRYPMKEAGYATEENLPAQQNASEEEAARRANGPTFPFLAAGRTYPGFSSPDPYRNALNRLRESSNSSEEARVPYPEGGPFALPPDRYPFAPPAAQPAKDAVPACARDANATMCFHDPEYPRRELLYALNSDSFLLDRLVLSDPPQRLDDIPLVSDQGGNSSADENYVCRADVEYGAPLRAKNTRGAWKVVVNVEGALAGGKFRQPLRTEVCRGGSGSPCSLSTDLRTRCVQKWSLQRLLAWSPEEGVHNDVFRVPVACSCQLL